MCIHSAQRAASEPGSESSFDSRRGCSPRSRGESAEAKMGMVGTFLATLLEASRGLIDSWKGRMENAQIATTFFTLWLSGLVSSVLGSAHLVYQLNTR